VSFSGAPFPAFVCSHAFSSAKGVLANP